MWNTCKAIVKRPDNIHYSTNESESLVHANVWARKQEKRWGSVLNASTIYAGDGLAIEIRQPTIKELRGRALTLIEKEYTIMAQSKRILGIDSSRVL